MPCPKPLEDHRNKWIRLPATAAERDELRAYSEAHDRSIAAVMRRALRALYEAEPAPGALRTGRQAP